MGRSNARRTLAVLGMVLMASGCESPQPTEPVEQSVLGVQSAEIRALARKLNLSQP